MISSFHQIIVVVKLSNLLLCNFNFVSISENYGISFTTYEFPFKGKFVKVFQSTRTNLLVICSSQSEYYVSSISTKTKSHQVIFFKFFLEEVCKEEDLVPTPFISPQFSCFQGNLHYEYLYQNDKYCGKSFKHLAKFLNSHPYLHCECQPFDFGWFFKVNFLI